MQLRGQLDVPADRLVHVTALQPVYHDGAGWAVIGTVAGVVGRFAVHEDGSPQRDGPVVREGTQRVYALQQERPGPAQRPGAAG